MADVRTVVEGPGVKHRLDYRPPAWAVPIVRLDVSLEPALSHVRATLTVERRGDEPLRLDGDGLELLSVRVDGAPFDGWRIDGGDLILDLPGDAHQVETEVEVRPDRNTQLMGLYASGGLLCTQCEAEGFRRITFFPDRPDVLSVYTVRMTADRGRYPILLANGDPVGQGALPDGRHWAEWHDPFPKPCYLFAMVAGDLAARRDRFVTRSGRVVDLAIWVKAADLPRTEHAMQALKDAMAFDERAFGREYDLALFNIVAVDDFNFGAMENKGLNIFNSRYVLADPDLATDADYDGIATVIAHEYLHNWSGNRVTCRDWFQLSLKEGFTVFRDQEFSADQGSPALKRIEDARALRATQFPEDAGPLAHPIRPDQYLEISNFYTTTIYSKGAEVVRMIRTIIGAEGFRRGSDLYFDRHDGQAATCEDFVRAMEDASGIDLGPFRLWYSQAGTPRISATVVRDDDGARLLLAQSVPPTPGQPEKLPMPVPLRFALFGRTSGRRLDERMVVLDGASAVVALPDLDEPVALSINRGFAAPVIVDARRESGDLAFLAAHDDDPFARYEAVQQVMLETMVGEVAGTGGPGAGAAVDAVRALLDDPTLDRAFVAETVLPPSEAIVGDAMAIVEPEAIHAARDGLRRAIGSALLDRWQALEADGADLPYSPDAQARARRRMRGIALGFLVAAEAPGIAALAHRRFEGADNMTDRLSALTALVATDGEEREAALATFHDRFSGESLVVDKWLSVQALAPRADTLARVEALAGHPSFTLANPNRVRALFGAFGANQLAFHHPSGRGYRLFARTIVALDRLNPQAAARLVPGLGRWRRFASDRAAMMRAALDDILGYEGLSPDVLEQTRKSLE